MSDFNQGSSGSFFSPEGEQKNYMDAMRVGGTFNPETDNQSDLADIAKSAGASGGNPVVAGGMLALSAYQKSRDRELQRQQQERELQARRIEAMRQSSRNLFG